MEQSGLRALKAILLLNIPLEGFSQALSHDWLCQANTPSKTLSSNDETLFISAHTDLPFNSQGLEWSGGAHCWPFLSHSSPQSSDLCLWGSGWSRTLLCPHLNFLPCFCSTAAFRAAEEGHPSSTPNVFNSCCFLNTLLCRWCFWAFHFPLCLCLGEKKIQNVQSSPSSCVCSELSVSRSVLTQVCDVEGVTSKGGEAKLCFPCSCWTIFVRAVGFQECFSEGNSLSSPQFSPPEQAAKKKFKLLFIFRGICALSCRCLGAPIHYADIHAAVWRCVKIAAEHKSTAGNIEHRVCSSWAKLPHF